MVRDPKSEVQGPMSDVCRGRACCALIACGDDRAAQGSMGDGVQARAAGFGRPFLLPKEGLRCIFKSEVRCFVVRRA